ncbi:metallophosphatase family protein [Lysinibacillus xylanilyticus]|uniref:metallophosphoesterase family protein n=1 Tax=Lysinibacillus xylanilyticus TaxID=582475 RepID=UPI002B245EC0|nr:metallophosphoesterase family protein [Lysinibacillus xylanilyticus]MEB2300039.1 metallophosphatase family protein [Lysinibacillus xylanilyticus]
MEIAVLSDIHGNKDALKAVLEDIKYRNIDKVYNLGDTLYGPLFPLETYEMIMSTNIKSVSGNCDRILLQSSSENPTVQNVIDMLKEEHKSWLISLPFSIQTDDFYFCHASPENDELYMLNDITPNSVILKQTGEIMNLVKDIPQHIIFCGHSHLPTIVYLPNNKIIINPGSVGLPAYEEVEPFYYKIESGTPFANYTVVEKRNGEWIIEQVSIPYDTTEVIKQSEAQNRSDWARALKCGRV